MWHTYQAAGARHLVVTGRLESDGVQGIYRDALPASVITLCRLHAGRAELTRRVISRGNGGSWSEPGDPLRGQPADFLAGVADRAAAEDDVLDHSSADPVRINAAHDTGQLSALRIDTDGSTVAEAAGLIAAATGFLAR